MRGDKGLLVFVKAKLLHATVTVSLSVFHMETKKKIISKRVQASKPYLPSYQEFYLLFKAVGCLVTCFVTLSITYKYCGQKDEAL